MIEKCSLVELQNATLDYKKDIIKKTLRKLSTPDARRNYLKQLGIRFDEKKKLFSGGAYEKSDLELKSLLCPITKMIFIEPVLAENGVTYEKSALISQFRANTFNPGLGPGDDMALSNNMGRFTAHRLRRTWDDAAAAAFATRGGSRQPADAWANLYFTTNKVMRHKVFKFKSEMGDNSKTQTFFRRHWNNRLAKKLGLGTYSMLSGWSNGTVGELYGLASRNHLVRNRLDTMLRQQEESGQLFKRRLLAILLLYIFIINPVLINRDDYMRYRKERRRQRRQNSYRQNSYQHDYSASPVGRAYDVLGISRGDDFYGIASVRQDLTLSELKKAFHKQALKHHPDKGGDIEEFKKIQAAYDLLKTYVGNWDFEDLVSA